MKKKKTLSFINLPFKPSTKEIIYIEGRYSETVNRVLQRHWEELDRTFGIEYDMSFCYLPQAHELLSDAQLRWYAPALTVQQARELLQQERLSLLDYLNDNHLKHSLLPGIGMFTCSSGDKAKMDFVELDYVNEQTYVEVFTDAVHRLLDIESDNQEEFIPGIMFSIARNLGFIDEVNSIARPIEGIEDDDEDADLCFNDDVFKLMREVEQKINRLHAMGVSKLVLSRLAEPIHTLSRLVVTRDLRLILPDYCNMEIEMTPLVKAVYLLFLRHTNGIVFKNLTDYRKELTEIYRLVRGGELSEKALQSVEDVTDSTKNSINEKCARIREAFLVKLNENLTELYMVNGDYGMPKRIALDRKLVTWETDMEQTVERTEL